MARVPTPDQSQPKPMAPTLPHVHSEVFDGDVVATASVGISKQVAALHFLYCPMARVPTPDRSQPMPMAPTNRKG